MVIGLWGTLNLSGCGTKTQPSPAAVGVYIDSATSSYLRAGFDQAKTCTQLSNGSYDDLTVIVMPPVFPCSEYSTGCSGEYTEPTLIQVGDLSAWKHEVIHYLLYANTGNPDTNDTSIFFTTCVS
ncbi:MAG TPA: hypothetical protein VN944_04500 [Nitrospiria bacterium]|nr:hypothetical protein [Nitrospiria bacterium]